MTDTKDKAASIKVTCNNCGNVFDWNDQWPDGLKRCPLCGILVQTDFHGSGNPDHESTEPETRIGNWMSSPKIYKNNSNSHLRRIGGIVFYNHK